MRFKPLIAVILIVSGCATGKKEENNLDKKNEKEPSLLNADVEKIWIPDRIENDQYIKGHYIYKIKRPSVWKAE